MLVLSRKTDERIQIGENITITVVQVKGNSVRIAIDAPKAVRILRSELEGKPAKVGANHDALNIGKSEKLPCDPLVASCDKRQQVGTADPGVLALYADQNRSVPINVKRRYYSCLS